MAEFVQLRKEKWTEPLSQLLQLDLLNQDEFRLINKIPDIFLYLQIHDFNFYVIVDFEQ